jgi:hypothetical protein
MFQSKSGKKFGSAFVGKRHDQEHDKMAKSVLEESPAHEEKETPEFEAGEQEGAKEGTENTEQPSQVAAEHQPATSVTTHHSKDKHVVVSRHPDGHMHMSQHKSHADAHAAAAQLSGAGQDENTNKSPNEDSYGDGAQEKDGFNMPRLA